MDLVDWEKIVSFMKDNFSKDKNLEKEPLSINSLFLKGILDLIWNMEKEHFLTSFNINKKLVIQMNKITTSINVFIMCNLMKIKWSTRFKLNKILIENFYNKVCKHLKRINQLNLR